MSKIIYSKFSNDRAEQFSIRTDMVLHDDGKRVIRKCPMTKLAWQHVQNMKQWEEKLNLLYQGTKICMNQCSMGNGYAEFEYVEGDTLEATLCKMLHEDRIEEANGLLDEFLSVVQEKNSQKIFEITEYFQKIFGMVTADEEWYSAEITNIDMITENIILNSRWNVIDFEWTFDFPIPVTFVLFRILFYLGESGEKERDFVEPFYEKYGISFEERKKFKIMEEHFQAFMVAGHKPIHELYGTMGKEIIPVHSLIHNREVMQEKEKIQIFYERGLGFSEKDSYCEVQEHKHKVCQIKIDNNVRAVRIDPATTFCQIVILQLTWNDETFLDKLKTNGYVCGNTIIFNTSDPQIILNREAETEGEIQIDFEVELLECGEAERRIAFWEEQERKVKIAVQQRDEIQNSFNDLKKHYDASIHQRNILIEQQQQILQSTSWKITCPLRKLNNFRKKKQIRPAWDKEWLVVIHCNNSTQEEIRKTIESLPEGIKSVLYTASEKSLDVFYGQTLYKKLYKAKAEYFWMLEAGTIWQADPEMVEKKLRETRADFLYGDALVNGHPFHKPEYNPEYLSGYNYIGSSWAVKKDIFLSAGFESSSYAYWNYRSILLFTEKGKKVVRIPQLLFCEKTIENNQIWEGERQALEDIMKVRMEKAFIRKGMAYRTFQIDYELQNKPLISIIIPNMNHKEDLERCLQSIRQKSTYRKYEIILVENNSTEEEIFEYYRTLRTEENIQIVTWKGEFNYSAINNFGTKYASGQYYLLLNNDVEIITPDWLEKMLMYAQKKEVGAVGAMLYYPNDTVQHAGVILGIGGVAGHSQKHFSKGDAGYYNRMCVPQDLSAVTAACMMVRKDVYIEVEGLDEEYKVAFNDVDFCMKVRKAGYKIVFTPYAELYHYESISRGMEDTPEKVQRFGNEVVRFQTKWKQELELGDPYYNPNLTLEKDDFSLA